MSDHLMGVYNRSPLTFVQGKGCWLYTAEGDAYLDCVSGVATNALGHVHPALLSALTEQAGKLWHVSNIFQIPEQEVLAARLTSACFADVVFFCNSGAEAVEAALKTARRYHAARGQPARTDIIGFTGAFHGRTYAALNAAGNQAYLDGFGPALPGYVHLDVGDAAAIAAAVARPTTAAVIIEPVQGEGGARVVPGEVLRRLRELCTANEVLLIYDEVQSGMGRTGQLFAHQWHEGVDPDLMAIAKALGCGFPVGACLATQAAAAGMTAGAHGSTFGGNPLAMAVALAAFDEITRPHTLEHVREIAEQLAQWLDDLQAEFPDIIAEVRGQGFLIGLKLIPNNRAFMAAARAQRLLVAGGGDNCIRLLPPLTMSLVEAGQLLDRLEATCRAVRAGLEEAA